MNTVPDIFGDERKPGDPQMLVFIVKIKTVVSRGQWGRKAGSRLRTQGK